MLANKRRRLNPTKDESDDDAGLVELSDNSEAQDTDFNEDVDGKTYYAMENDELPEHKVFDGRWHKLDEAVKEFVQQASLELPAETMVTHPELAGRLDAMRSLPTQTKVTIGLIGDAGAGKSSLINSLLSDEDLADTGDTGSACTNVPTIYTSKIEGYAAKIETNLAAKVEFHQEGLESFLRQLIQDCRNGFIERASLGAEGDEEGHGEAQIDAEEAFSMLHGLVRTHSWFETEEKLRHALESCAGDDDSKDSLDLTRAIVSHVRSVLTSASSQPGCPAVYVEAPTTTELHEKLAQFTRETNNEAAVDLWPLVKHVTVAIPKKRILDNATLVDMAGLDDSNKLRHDTTHRLLDTCKMFMVVARINRILDSRRHRELIERLRLKFGRRAVVLVCTFADAFMKRTTFKVLQKTMPKADKDRFQSLHAHDHMLEKNLHALQYALRRESDSKRKRTLRQRILAQRRQWKKQVFLNDLELMKWSVSNVENSMQKKFPGLQVLGISNELYRQLLNEKPEKHFGLLTPGVTQIDRLKKMIFIASANEIHEKMRRFLDNPVHNFLALLRICAHGQGFDTYLDIRLNLPSQKLRDRVVQHFKSDTDMFEQLVIQPTLDEVEYHTGQASETMLKKEERPYCFQNWRAFARRRGIHKTSRIEHENWNEQIVSSISRRFRSVWDTLKIKRSREAEDAGSDLRSMLNESSPFRDEHFMASAPQPVKEYEQSFKNHCLQIETLLTEDSKACSKAIGDVAWMMQGTGPQSYALTGLSETYSAIGNECGTGCYKRMKATMQTRIKCIEPNLFESIAVSGREAYATIRKEDRSKVLANINDILTILEENHAAAMKDFRSQYGVSESQERIHEFYEKVAKSFQERIEQSNAELDAEYGKTSI